VKVSQCSTQQIINSKVRMNLIHEGKTVWVLYNLPICDAKINLSVRERYFSESVVNPLILD
jgi:hypothetical protein